MSQPRKYKAEVLEVLNPVDNVYSLVLRSLSGKFRFQPGQFLHLALDEYDPSFGWPESRCFSIQSSPLEDYIKVTYSVKGFFTKQMSVDILPGRVLDLKLPYGNLFQTDHNKEYVVFIAGGTGITPFLSLFADPSFSAYKKPRLYFGAREERFNLYETELSRALDLNNDLNIKITYQNIEGIIDIDRIINENSRFSTYFISGPQSMISSFKIRLKSAGVDDQLIRTDDWE